MTSNRQAIGNIPDCQTKLNYVPAQSEQEHSHRTYKQQQTGTAIATNIHTTGVCADEGFVESPAKVADCRDGCIYTWRVGVESPLSRVQFTAAFENVRPCGAVELPINVIPHVQASTTEASTARVQTEATQLLLIALDFCQLGL